MASGTGNSALVEIYDARIDKWTAAAPMPAPVHGHAMAAVGSTLIVCGGVDQCGEDDRNCWLYAARTDKWAHGPQMPQGRLFGTAAAVGDSVFVMGNRAYGDVPLLRYDVRADRWQIAAPASVRAHRTCSAVLDGHIYVVAGEGDDAELSRVSRFNASTGEWSHSD
jgi:hypothetical protein